LRRQERILASIPGTVLVALIVESKAIIDFIIILILTYF